MGFCLLVDLDFRFVSGIVLFCFASLRCVAFSFVLFFLFFYPFRLFFTFLFFLFSFSFSFFSLSFLILFFFYFFPFLSFLFSFFRIVSFRFLSFSFQLPFSEDRSHKYSHSLLTDISLKRTSGAGPCRTLSFTSSPSKEDTSLRRTVGAGPERVHLRGS